MNQAQIIICKTDGIWSCTSRNAASLQVSKLFVLSVARIGLGAVSPSRDALAEPQHLTRYCKTLL